MKVETETKAKPTSTYKFLAKNEKIFFLQKMSAGWRAGCVPIRLKKCCPQSLVCFWQIRMRRTRAGNINEVKNLSRWRPFSSSRQSRPDILNSNYQNLLKSTTCAEALRYQDIQTFRILIIKAICIPQQNYMLSG